MMGWVVITITFLMDKCHQTQIIVVVKILLLHKNIILGLRVSFSVIQPHISRHTLTNHSSNCDKNKQTNRFYQFQIQQSSGTLYHRHKQPFPHVWYEAGQHLQSSGGTQGIYWLHPMRLSIFKVMPLINPQSSV